MYVHTYVGTYVCMYVYSGLTSDYSTYTSEGIHCIQRPFTSPHTYVAQCEQLVCTHTHTTFITPTDTKCSTFVSTLGAMTNVHKANTSTDINQCQTTHHRGWLTI